MDEPDPPTKDAVPNKAVASKPRTSGKSRKTSAPRPDPADARLAAAQGAVLAVTVVLAAVAVWRPLVDPFMLPKLTVLVCGGVLLGALAGVRAVRNGRLTLPGGPPLWVAGAFALALGLATAVADNGLVSLIGEHGRYGGLLSYLAYLVIFLVALRLYSTGSARGLMTALLVAVALVSAYGLLQVAGLDPYTWSSGKDQPVFSTLGNTNFAAAYVAMLLPVAAAVVVFRGWSRGWRVAAGVVLVVAGIYVVATGATQGLVAAAAGLGVVGVARLLTSADRRPSRTLLAGAAALALVALVLAAVWLAPEVARSGAERVQFWQAALGIFADHPALGTGLDSFRDLFPQYRPEEHAVQRGYQSTDSAHNVPLGMFAGGGLPLGLTYLALVGFTGWTLVRGLRSLSGERLQVLAAFGGVWAAYQVQSLVSVDVPAVTVLHFLSAALVIATATAPAIAGLRLPVPTAARGELLPRRAAERRPAVLALALVLLVSLALGWLGLRPLRADLLAADGRGLEAGAGLPALDRAVSLAPWEAEYRLLQAQARLDGRDAQGAYEAAAEAAEIRRGSAKLALGAADLAVRLQDTASAERWVAEALRRDPNNPEALTQAAELVREHDLAQDAEALTGRAEQLERDFSS